MAKEPTILLSRQDARYVLCLILHKTKGKSAAYYNDPINLEKELKLFAHNPSWKELSRVVFKELPERRTDGTLRKSALKRIAEKKTEYNSENNDSVRDSPSYQKVLYEFSLSVKRGEPTIFTREPFDAILNYIGQDVQIAAISCSEKSEITHAFLNIQLAGSVWTCWSLDQLDGPYKHLSNLIYQCVIFFGMFNKVIVEAYDRNNHLINKFYGEYKIKFAKKRYDLGSINESPAFLSKAENPIYLDVNLKNIYKNVYTESISLNLEFLNKEITAGYYSGFGKYYFMHRCFLARLGNNFSGATDCHGGMYTITQTLKMQASDFFTKLYANPSTLFEISSPISQTLTDHIWSERNQLNYLGSARGKFDDLPYNYQDDTYLGLVGHYHSEL